jgi:hypothetical protein
VSERERFRESAGVLLRVEWRLKAGRTGDAAAWLWVEKLTAWADAHDWTVQRLGDRRLVLPFHLVVTDAIEEAQVAASEFLRTLPVPPEVVAKKEAERNGIYTGPKRGRPKKVG